MALIFTMRAQKRKRIAMAENKPYCGNCEHRYSRVRKDGYGVSSKCKATKGWKYIPNLIALGTYGPGQGGPPPPHWCPMMKENDGVKEASAP